MAIKSTAVPKPIIILIHGTFARGATWTRSDSPFARAIRDAFGPEAYLTQFDWSGKNSHWERLKAGEALAEYIRHLKDQYQEAKFFLVAHSHGGNVIAYALRQEDVRAATEKVVCLGTPFIHAQRRDLKPTFRLLRYLGIATTVTAALLVYAITVGLLGGDYLSPEEDHLLLRIFSAGFVIGLIYLLVHYGNKLVAYIRARVHPLLEEKQQAIVHNLDSTISDIRVLLVRVVRDEAAGYLAVVNHLANIPFRLWSPAAVYWSVGALLAVITILFLSLGFNQEFIETQGEIGTLTSILAALAVTISAVIVGVFILFLFAMLICLIWPKIFRGHALGFGEKGLIYNWLVSIRSSVQPLASVDPEESVYEIDGIFPIRHSSLYKDARIYRRVADWLTKDAGKSHLE